MKKIYLSVVLLALVFVGCGTKRQYFEPKETAGEIIYTGSLPSSMSELSRYGATLENGQIITKDGLSKITLKKGFSYVGEFEDRYICVNDNGVVRVLNKDGEKVYEKKFKQAVATASINGETLAVIDSANTMYLVNMTKDDIYFTNKQDKTYAVDARIAAPHFLNSLVIFPTLDGKLVIVDWKEGTLVRDVVISSEPFFNNVIYLNVINSRLIAATSKRAISIAPRGTTFLDENIKDFMSVGDDVVLLSDDGRVIILDEKLKVKKEHKFLFAVFLGVMNENALYIAERNGYLIETDMNLEDTKVYKLPEEIDELMFMANDTIFYDDNIIKLHDE